MHVVVVYMLTYWKIFHQKQHHLNILSSLYLVCTQDTIFDAVEFQWRYRKNPFSLGDAYLKTFFSTCLVDFRTTHGKNNIPKCYTEGFVPVTSLNCMVGSPPLFIRSLIGGTGKYDMSYISIKNEYMLLELSYVP